MLNLKLKTTLLPIGVGLFVAAVWWINVSTFHSRGQHLLFSTPSMRLRAITEANQEMLVKRNKLLLLYQQFLHHKPIGMQNVEWIRKQRYIHLIYFNPYSNKDWQTLLEAYQPVPVKPIVQHAADLSNYGTSPLAQHANNFFRVLISRPEFGWPGELVSKQQRQLNWLQSNDIQYARYLIPQRAVTDYIWMLNTAAAFKPFRQYRDYLLKQHKNLNHLNSTKIEKLLAVTPYATDSHYGNNNLPTFPHVKVMS